MPIAPAVGAAMIGSGTQIGGSLLSMLVQKKREKRAMANTKELMAIQQKNQQELNEQGQELQLDTWNKTNYPAQMEMLKEAGLNPALLYGMSGGGGTTTGSQSGGTAASGSAPAPMQPMDLGNAISGAKAAAEIALIQAQKKKTEAESNVIEETGTEEAKSRISKIIAETENTETKTELERISVRIRQFEEAYSVAQLDADLNRTLEEVDKLELENKLTRETWEDVKLDIAQTALSKEFEIEAIRQGVEHSKADIQKMAAEITQKWVELKMKSKELEQRDRDLNIRSFEAAIKAEYPNVWNLLGGGVQHSVNVIEDIMTGKRRTYNTPETSKYKGEDQRERRRRR